MYATLVHIDDLNYIESLTSPLIGVGLKGPICYLCIDDEYFKSVKRKEKEWFGGGYSPNKYTYKHISNNTKFDYYKDFSRL